MIGYALCGSFCTHSASLGVLETLAATHEILPIMSGSVYSTDTRFGTADALRTRVRELCRTGMLIHTIYDAEPIGPVLNLEALIIAPCTGNTLAKLACGITDTPVTMAAKAHLRSDRPLLVALASNDALSANLGNIAALLRRKNVYFVPLLQDDPKSKPHSLVADFSKIPEALTAAINGIQLRPLFV